MCNLGVKNMFDSNYVELNEYAMLNRNHSLYHLVDDEFMPKKILEYRLNVDEEMNEKLIFILDEYEKIGMSADETMKFVLEMGMYDFFNILKMVNLFRKRENFEKYECKSIDDEYSKNRMLITFVTENAHENNHFQVVLEDTLLEKVNESTRYLEENMGIEAQFALQTILTLVVTSLSSELKIGFDAREMLFDYLKYL
jgi:hypothetical protein